MSNRITKIAIVGAAGNIGTYITAALLKTGKHTITAITREDSQATFPERVISKKVDYRKPERLVEALRGQDALITTLSGHAVQTESQLVKAAADAGVLWILPNEWSPDTANENLVKDVFVFQPKVATRKLISDLGKSSFTAVVTGFWYEYTLAMPASFGIDFVKRAAHFYDDGETKISVSTMAQIGCAVASLLSLPIKADGAACLEDFRNQVVYINSFTVSQKDMFQSALCVTGTREDEWTITKESAQQRYTDGLEEIKQGKRTGYAKMMYTRVFFADRCGDFESNKRTLNGVLGLKGEEIDEATRLAEERAKKPHFLS